MQHLDPLGHLSPLEPGAMFWAERDKLSEMQSLGVRCGQLGIGGEVALSTAYAERWKADLDRAKFTLVTVFAAYTGEDYADAPTVERTVGFMPSGTRAAREQRTLEVSDFAAALGVGGIACHVGFVPHDGADPEYLAVRDLVRRVADHAARHGQTFAMETGQEPADILLRFFGDVDRPNLRINFDPANMILYGTGDPVDALKTLAPHVVSVHAKDGDWPPAGQPAALGTERPLGHGSVGMDRFVRALAGAGFRGPLNVERETEDQAARMREMGDGVALLRKLVAAL